MAEKMLRYIFEQPVVLRDILDRREEVTAPLAAALAGREIDRVVLVGTGSSLNAANAAAPFFEAQLGVETLVRMPTRLGAVWPRPERTLALVISQSGRSTSSLKAAAALRAAGAQVAAVTADTAAPLAGACEALLPIACGEETVGPKTKGFTGTVLTLYLGALALAKAWGTPAAGEAWACHGLLGLAITNMAENLARSREFCERHLKVLAARPHFALAADGSGWPVAAEGALKVLETLYVPAFAYEFEEYLHGINNTIAPGACNFFLPAEPAGLDRVLRLDAFCRAHGCADYLVTTLDAPEAPHILKLVGTGAGYTLPFESLLFFQLLSAMGSEAKGFEVDRPKFPEFYGLMETKA